MKSSTATKLAAASAAAAIFMVMSMSAPAPATNAFSPNRSTTRSGHSSSSSSSSRNRRRRKSNPTITLTPSEFHNGNDEKTSSIIDTNHINSFKNNIMELHSTTTTTLTNANTRNIQRRPFVEADVDVVSDAATDKKNGGIIISRDKPKTFAAASQSALLEPIVATIATTVTLLVLFERYDAAATDASTLNTALVTAVHHLTQVPLQAYHAYEQILHTNPITTKAATSATVYTIGDVVAQFTEQRSKEQEEEEQQVSSKSTATTTPSSMNIDTGRVVRSLIAGGVGHGPLSHVWYHLSEQFFDAVGLTTQVWWSVIPKIAVDQIVWGTIWNTLYLTSVGIMQLAMTPTPTTIPQSKTTEQSTLSLSSIMKVFEETKSSIVPLFVDGLKLWPFAHIITYGVIPVEDRLLWVDAVEIIWVAIMATKAAEKTASLKEPADTSNMEPAAAPSISAVAP